MKRTVSIPINIDRDRFLPLMESCSSIFNDHVDWALENDTYNKSKAHGSLYQLMKEKHPNIPTAFIQSVRDTAMEAVKATKGKRKPRKKKYSGIRCDKRTMTLRGHQLTLSCIGPREKVILEIPEYFSDIFNNWNFKGATLTYTVKTKQFWIRMVYETETPQMITEGHIIGIDRGIKHLAVTSDGKFFSNSGIRANQRRYLHNRKTLQEKGTQSSKRLLKAISGKEKRFSRDVNHQVSKKLVNQNDVCVFVLEDLKGIRGKRRGKILYPNNSKNWIFGCAKAPGIDYSKQAYIINIDRFTIGDSRELSSCPKPIFEVVLGINKSLSSWPFYQFAMFLEYKAEQCGKIIAYVDARYTSQKCSCCKVVSKENRNKSKYQCKICKFSIHADWNAAINIKDNYILSSTPKASEEQAAVNPPPEGRNANYEASLNVSTQVSDTSLQPCAVGS